MRITVVLIYMILFIFRQFEFHENFRVIGQSDLYMVVVRARLEEGRKLMLTLSTISVLSKGTTQD